MLNILFRCLKGPPLPPKNKVAQALFDFQGERESDLSFKQGDLISITRMEGEWWQGQLQGKLGEFPANYVQLK